MPNVNKLDVTKTAIEGLVLLSYRRYQDDRGENGFPIVIEELEAALGFPLPKLNVNRTVSHRGVIRGVHWNPWDKIVWVDRGAVFVAIVEGRNNGNFGQVVCLALKDGEQLFIPEGCGNSFQSTSPEDSVYYYGVTGRWREEDKHLYRSAYALDPELAIPWPITPNPVLMSAEDLEAPAFSEFQPIEF